MLKIENFHESSGWLERDAPLSGLAAQMGVKLSVGGEGSKRDLHRHNTGEKEIFVVIAGTAKALVDGQEITLGRRKGETWFLLMEDEQHGIFDKSEGFRCAIAFIKPVKS